MDQLFMMNEINASEEATQTTEKKPRIRRTKKAVEQARREEALQLLGLAPATSEDAAGMENVDEVDEIERQNQILLYQKLQKIQSQCLSFIKDAHSKGADGNGFDYVSGSRVLGYIRPLMDESNLQLIPEVVGLIGKDIMDILMTDEKGEQKWTKQALYVLRLKFIWLDSATGARLEVPFISSGCNGLDQGIGSALTYAERYFLLKYFHIPTDNDDIDSLGRVLLAYSNTPVQTEQPGLVSETIVHQEPEKKAEKQPRKKAEKKPAAKEEKPEAEAEKPAEQEQEAPAKEEEAAAPAESEAPAAEQPAEISLKELKEDLGIDDEGETSFEQAKAEADAEAEKQPKAEVKAETEAAAEAPKAEDDKAPEMPPMPATDDKGRELKVTPVEENASKPELVPDNPWWYKVIMRCFSTVSKLTKDEMLQDIRKDYTITNENFETLYSQLS